MPTFDDPEVWAQVEALCGYAVPPRVRLFATRRLHADWTRLPVDQLAKEIAKLVHDLELSGLVEGRPEVRGSEEAAGALGWTPEPRGTPDEKWAVWADLVARAKNRMRWTPIACTVVRDESVSAMPSVRIELSIDHRMSASMLKREVDSIWQQLREAGWVRWTRPLSPKWAALVRFVCLESELDESWDERLLKWNTYVSEHAPADWAYSDRWAMSSDFRRAETQLTGRRHGLSWFYESEDHKCQAPSALQKAREEWATRWERDELAVFAKSMRRTWDAASEAGRAEYLRDMGEYLGEERARQLAAILREPERSLVWTNKLWSGPADAKRAEAMLRILEELQEAGVEKS